MRQTQMHFRWLPSEQIRCSWLLIFFLSVAAYPAFAFETILTRTEGPDGWVLTAFNADGEVTVVLSAERLRLGPAKVGFFRTNLQSTPVLHDAKVELIGPQAWSDFESLLRKRSGFAQADFRDLTIVTGPWRIRAPIAEWRGGRLHFPVEAHFFLNDDSTTSERGHLELREQTLLIHRPDGTSLSPKN